MCGESSRGLRAGTPALQLLNHDPETEHSALGPTGPASMSIEALVANAVDRQ